MSGTHLVEQSPEAAVTTTDTSAEDNAASLRAAALRTLKLKRRKLTANSDSTTHRPFVQQQSIQLDYGSEEPSGGASSIASSPALQPVKSSVPMTEPMDVDAGAREEGEISDSEMSPPPPSVKPQPEPTSHTSAQPPQPVTQMLPPPLPKVEPVSPALGKAVAASVAATTAQPIPADKYVRPGLAMTEAQYITARDIILDLLGWGVPPEYLVECGLSREIIFYIFVEYNLRLPSNLDVTGLLPYTSPTTQSATMHGSLTVHPGASQKPSAQVDTSSSLSATAPAFIPGSSTDSSTPDPSLLDMEQQRKQELWARKTAAMASRKLKQQKSTSSVESQLSDTATPMASSVASSVASSKGNTGAVLPVHTKTVDDFLNSIDAVGTSSGAIKPSESAAKPRVRAFSLDAMEVNEVPGLTGGFSITTDYTPLPRPPPTRSATISSATSPKSPVVPHSAVSTASDRSFYAPPMFSNGGALPYGANDDDSDAIPGLFQTRSPSVESQAMGSRRGTKRPVAADFVDMEPGPSRNSARVPPKRRSTGFAGLSQRRCVIELSDTEDEHEDGRPYTNGLPSRTESRGPPASTPQLSVAPTPRVNSPANMVNPAALLEKEEQIRRMREAIAQKQREQNLRKQAATSRSTPLTQDTPPNVSVTIKQEEDESSTVRSLQASRSSSSATPDPAVVMRPTDTTVERSAAAQLPHETSGSIALPESESASDATTPIDVSFNALEHHTTGDKVLTGEAQQEQAGTTSEEPDADSMEVDVVGTRPETSAQVVHDTGELVAQEPEQAPAFETYRSLLDRHPLLRAHSRPESSSLAPPLSSSAAVGSSSSTTQITDIDLKPLKQAAVVKYLSDNTRQICQYELPGGGECRDKSCENVHLSRLSAVEPSDEDTAQYLCSLLPGGQRYGVEVFMKALDVARLSHPTMPFDARVQEALSRLGLR